MVLTKRQKMMVGVVGLGLVALTADKLMLGGGQTGPSQANAAVGFAPSAADGSARPKTAGAKGSELLDNSLASRLDVMRETLGMDLGATNDAFCPSKTWLSDLRPEERIVTSSDEVRVIDFSRAHELKGVITGGEGGAAYIDDKYVRMGQVIDGFRLVKLGYRMAVLESNGVAVVLRLKSQPRDR